MRALTLGAVLVGGLAIAATGRAATDPLRFVDPFVGTGGDNGNTFPGAVLPSGMVQFSPVSATTASPGGYSYDDSTIRGFALTRLSGAGCANLGDLPIMPLATPFDRLDPATGGVPSSVFRHARESASPGSYRVTFDNGVAATLTATLRTGEATFAYPQTAAYVALDAGGGSTKKRALSIRVTGRQEVSGSITSGGFCDGPAYSTLHFVARFDRPMQTIGSWGQDGVVQPGVAVEETVDTGGLLLGFQARSIRVKIGVSYVSERNASLNLSRESPGWDFRRAERAARAAWNKALGAIDVRGASPSIMTTFYTALYHALIHPSLASDVNGQFRRRDGLVGTARGYRRLTNISGWDIYRTQVPLLALIAPQTANDLVRSMLAGAAESGTVAKWEYAGAEGGIMVGDPAAPIIAGSYAFGARRYDVKAAYAALERGAVQASPGPFIYPSNLVAIDGSAFGAFVDRPGLADYLEYGYVPFDQTAGYIWGPAATTLEYGVADFALSRLASAARNEAASARFLARSTAWRKLLNPSTGYLEPRNTDGSFLRDYMPASKIGFVEGNATQYSWMVPYDLAGLVRAVGPSRASVRLDSFLSRLNTNRLSPYAWLGNEPSFGAPWVYLWLHSPARTQATIHRALTTLFQPRPAGLPGDDDLGALSAWYVWSSLGLYPAIPGVGGLALASPSFMSGTIGAGSRRITFTTHSSGRYVRGLTVDGRPYTRTWLPLPPSPVKLGFDLSKRQTSWGTGRSASPPSFSPAGR
jgi:predicted alpha-1,2-mannosidase